MEVILHIGAHRTGSTLLQHMMAEARAPLAAAGVCYVTLDDLRAGITRAVGVEGVAARLGQHRIRRNMRALLTEAAQSGADRLVLSDENLAGPMRKIFTETGLYAGAKDRLARLAQALSGLPLTLCLAVRSYVWFYASAFAHLCRSRRMPDFETLKPVLLTAERRWPACLDQIRSVLPGARLVVWTHEALKTRLSDVLSMLSAGRWDPAMAGDPWWANASPSGRAVTEMQSRRAAGETLGKDDITAIEARYPKGPTPGFYPWSEAEAELLDRRYARDLEDIARRSDHFIGAPA